MVRIQVRHGLGGVVPDRLNGAAFHRLFAESFLLGRLGLLENIGVAPVLVAGEIGGCRFAAQVAVDALVVTVVTTGSI